MGACRVLHFGTVTLTLKGIEYVRNETDICVYNKEWKDGAQCTLLITTVSKRMIAELTKGLRARYGEITLKHGPC
jgi:hypothetical protein